MYLDGELQEHDKEKVEAMLHADPEARHMLNEVRAMKESTLKNLDQLNPQQEATLPGWTEPSHLTFTASRLPKKALRWVAILILPLAVFLLFRELITPSEKEVFSPDSSSDDKELLLLPEEDNIDFAISPNRSWSKKNMIDFEIILNSY